MTKILLHGCMRLANLLAVLMVLLKPVIAASDFVTGSVGCGLTSSSITSGASFSIITIKCLKSTGVTNTTSGLTDSDGNFAISLATVVRPRNRLLYCTIEVDGATSSSPCPVVGNITYNGNVTPLPANVNYTAPQLCLLPSQGTCLGPAYTGPSPCNQTFNSCKSCSQSMVVRTGRFTSLSFKQIVSQSLTSCCSSCRSDPGCVYFSYSKATCRLYDADSACTGAVSFFDRTKTAFVSAGKCNPSVANDPHFVGGHGTLYDFNGLPDKTFALFTDSHFQINMRLSGYYSDDTTGATPTADGKSIRTWIREATFFWRKDGISHSLLLTARDGKEQKRGDGFLKAIELDGQRQHRLAPGKSLHSDSGVHLSLLPPETLGPYDVDHYTLEIENLLKADLHLRIAHPNFQLPDDSEVHINLGFIKLNYSDAVHGVLGQTYRSDRDERTAHFKELVKQLNGPIKADAASGSGFLDGGMADYETGGPLDTSCKFCLFQGASKSGTA